MYHTIVASIARKNFEAVNRKDYESVLAGCTDDIRHEFGGVHACGGVRHDKAHLKLWFERLGRVAPDLKLTVKDVWVKGWPWDTTIFIRWIADAKFPAGTPYRNHGVHVIHMAWGKVDSIDANEDSQIVARFLAERAAAGCEEAAAPMIES